jgi:hypothetical protein
MATDLGKLLAEIGSLSAEEKLRLREYLDIAINGHGEDARAGEGGVVAADLQYQELLKSAGLLREVKPRKRDQAAFDSYRPVQISGRPLSETIVEERH